MIQLEDNKWYRPRMNGFTHECCDCGLQHEVYFKKLRRGIIFKWVSIKKKKRKRPFNISHKRCWLKITP